MGRLKRMRYRQDADVIEPRVLRPAAVKTNRHPLVALQQIVGNRSVQRLVARAPAASTPPKAAPPAGATKSVASASADVQNSYHVFFNNQRSGLTRLHAALKNEKPESSLVATLASAAVGTALGVLLGPVGEAAAELVAAGDRALVLKAADKIKEFAVDKAKEKVKDYLSESKESDPKDNFLEAQSLALNWSEGQTIHEFLRQVDDLAALPNGMAALDAMSEAILVQARSAADVQVANAAGQWASIIKSAGSDSRAWANDDNETFNEKGAIEIRARVDTAPLKDAEQINITGSNWAGVNRETEKVVQEHPGATIGQLGAALRVTITTPVGETRFEYQPHGGNPVIPVKSTMQGVMIWLQTGKYDPMTNDGAILSTAAYAGILLKSMSVGKLKFGE